MVGPVPPRPSERQAIPKWKLVVTDPSRLYFDYDPQGIRLLAIQSTVTSPPILRRSILHNQCTLARYFYTAASLESITDIVPCLGGLQVDSPIVGLLLRYSDGRRACVGKARLDRLGPRIVVDASEVLFLGFARTARMRRQYVASVEVSKAPPDQGSLAWLGVPWKGRLEWWFTSAECFVFTS